MFRAVLGCCQEAGLYSTENWMPSLFTR